MSNPSDPILKLEALAQKAGPPNAALLDALLAGTSEAELIEQGRTIDSKRLITDGARLYELAWSYWSSLSPADQQNFKGVSTELLVLGIDQCLHLEQTRKNRSDTMAAERTGRSEVEAQRTQVRDDAMAARDELALAMRDAAAHEHARRSALDTAIGNASTVENLAMGLESLSKLLGDWFLEAQTNSIWAARLQLANLSPSDIQKTNTLAKDLRSADAKASQVSSTPKITQGELDRADGINIHILGRLIRAFDMAHDRNPAVPRLIPIAARRLFRSSVKNTPTTPDTPSEGAPDANHTPA